MIHHCESRDWLATFDCINTETSLVWWKDSVSSSSHESPIFFVSTQPISLADSVLMMMTRQTIRCWLIDWKTFFLNKLAIRTAFWLIEIACLRAAFWLIGAACLRAAFWLIGAAFWMGFGATFWLRVRATFWLMSGAAFSGAAWSGACGGAWSGACSGACWMRDEVACSEGFRACWLGWLTKFASGGDWMTETFADWIAEATADWLTGATED